MILSFEAINDAPFSREVVSELLRKRGESLQIVSAGSHFARIRHRGFTG